MSEEETDMPTANDLTPLDDTVVRNTAAEVKEVARRAHRVEIALVVVAAVLMVTVAGFTGYNTHRLRDVNRNLTHLVETVEANQLVQQTYSEDHASSTADSHAALAHNIACMADYFQALAAAAREATPLPDKTVLGACFEPTKGAPPAKPLPGNDKRREGD